MISYAQNAEDVLLARLFAGQDSGFYLDVGAHHPVDLSVTKHFYDLGWRGINVEPQPDSFGRISDARARDVNLNVGVSDRDGTMTFFESLDDPGWSTFSPEQARSLRARGMAVAERAVPVTTLAAICERHADRPIDFLKVDAESHEREVLAGADWGRWRPRAVVVEANGVAAWEPILRAADYSFACFDGVNRYYLRAEDGALRPRLDAPACVLDGYIPYRYAREIEALRAELAELGAGGETSLRIVRGLKHLAGRYPRAARVVRGLIHRAG
jgi:FkbM family methyltransferase